MAIKNLYEIEGREYLKDNHSEEYELFKDLYHGDHYKHFPIDEFEYTLSKYNYVAYNVIRFAIDSLTNLFGINKAVVDFGSQDLNNIFEEKRKQIDFDEKIENLIRDYRLYGNSYIAVNRTEKGSRLENINPSIVYADYNDFNLGMEAKKYTIVYEKEIKEAGKETEVYLLVDYLEGQIILTAYKEIGEEYTQIKPLEYFPELFDGIDTTGDYEIVIETGVDYPSIIALHNTQKDSFYGESQLTSSVVGLQELVNKLGNLAKFAITNNSVPKLKLSESSAKILQGIIDDNEGGALPVPTRFSEVKNAVQNSFRSVSWAFSSIVAKMGKKLMFFKENGRGTTEYLINNYKLDDLFIFQKDSEQKLLRELQVSPTLYNPDSSSGNIASGIAYKRLMQLSIQEVENMRIKSQDQISKIVQILMVMDGFDTPAPKIEFAPIIEEEVLNTSNDTPALTKDNQSL